MECLQELCLDGTGIKELPSSIGHLKSLELLNLKNCSKLVGLPSSIGGCEFLKTLNLSCCSLEIFPENLRGLVSLKKLYLSVTALTTLPSFIFRMKNLEVLSLQACKGPPSRIRSHWPFILRATKRLSPSSATLTLPATFSGLSSLKVLNLADCNLYDGVIPNDICSLSLLEILRLDDNNFTTLPTALGQLSKLTFLTLFNCKRLISLPGLPATIGLGVNGCASLEAVAQSTTTDSRVGGHICAFNCFRLAKHNNAVALPKGRLKVAAMARKQLYDIFLPGNEIPQWFSHHSSNSIIKIPLPPNFLDDNQLLGFVFCCVFFADSDNKLWREHLSCRRMIHGRNYSREVGCGCLIHFSSIYTRMTKDHLWLTYLPCDSFLECEKTEISSSRDRAPEESFEMEVLFEIFGIHSKVKKCGVRILYEKDLEDMDQNIDDHHRPTSSNFNDVRPNDGLTGNIGAPVKRKWLNYRVDDQRTEPYFCRPCQAYIKEQR